MEELREQQLIEKQVFQTLKKFNNEVQNLSTQSTFVKVDQDRCELEVEFEAITDDSFFLSLMTYLLNTIHFNKVSEINFKHILKFTDKLLSTSPSGKQEQEEYSNRLVSDIMFLITQIRYVLIEMEEDDLTKELITLCFKLNKQNFKMLWMLKYKYAICSDFKDFEQQDASMLDHVFRAQSDQRKITHKEVELRLSHHACGFTQEYTRNCRFNPFLDYAYVIYLFNKHDTKKCQELCQFLQGNGYSFCFNQQCLLLLLNKDRFHLLKNVNDSTSEDKPSSMMLIACYEFLAGNKHTSQSMFEFINKNFKSEDIYSIMLTVCIFNGFEDIQQVLDFLSKKCHKQKQSIVTLIQIKQLAFLQQHSKCIFRLKNLKLVERLDVYRINELIYNYICTDALHDCKPLIDKLNSNSQMNELMNLPNQDKIIILMNVFYVHKFIKDQNSAKSIIKVIQTISSESNNQMLDQILQQQSFIELMLINIEKSITYALHSYKYQSANGQVTNNGVIEWQKQIINNFGVKYV